MQKKYSIHFPCSAILARLKIPASKSLSNRLLLLNYLSKAETKLLNLSNSGDTKLLEYFCKELHQITDTDKTHIFNCNNAGTVFRFLTPVLAQTKGSWIITGSERMQQRPIAPLVDALRSMGAKITYMNKEGFPPLQIEGCNLAAQKVYVDASISSQFVSALMLLASGNLPKPFEIHFAEDCKVSKKVSLPYITMTAALLRVYGLSVKVADDFICIEGMANKPAFYFVEADWTSASYFYALLVLAKEGHLSLPDFFKDSLQGDAVIAELFTQFGISTRFEKDGIQLVKRELRLPTSFSFDFTNHPDLAQTMVVLCAALGIQGHFYGLSSLKYKETDRLAALCFELRKLGLSCFVDGIADLHISSQIKNTSVCIDTYDDHRMAMAFSILTIKYPKIMIANPQLVEKSFVNYWDCLKKLGAEIREK